MIGTGGPTAAQLAGKEIHLGIGGPLTTGSATFGVEMRQAVELVIAPDSFARGFEAAGGTIVVRQAIKVGDTDFQAMLNNLPKDFDVLFFAGIREGALVLKQMRALRMDALFACGDGCWDVKGFIVPAEGAATKGEGVRILSAAPSLGKVPGSAEFAARYGAIYGPINNHAANSYDAARLIIAAIEQAATAKKAMPTRAEVLSALRSQTFQGIAYARPVEWNAKGDNVSAVIFVNTVEGDHFREITQIAGAS